MGGGGGGLRHHARKRYGPWVRLLQVQRYADDSTLIIPVWKEGDTVEPLGTDTSLLGAVPVR